MRRILTAVASLTVLAVLSAGCRRAQPAQDPRINDLEAEIAALRAEVQALQSSALQTRSGMDPDKRAELERSGVNVSETDQAVKLTLPNSILFASGSATLRNSSLRALDKSAALITTDYADSTVVVEGHTDNQPIKRTRNLWKSNQELSLARAEAVAAYLRKAGVLPANIAVVGHADTKPVADNKTVKGRALNRRVEITVKIAR